MLSRLVIAFLPRSKRLLISWLHHHLQWFWSPKNKVCHCFHCFPIYLPWSDGTGCHDLSFLQFSSVQSLSHVWLFAAPWIAARQASLSITSSWSLPKLMSIKSVMPSSHVILRHPFSSCPHSLPASWSFPVSQLFTWGGQSTGVSALASVLPKKSQGWSPSVKEESEKVGWKLNIQKTKIMASGPITSWEIDGETLETVSNFIFLGSKITADGDCSHEIRRRLLLGRKVMTNLDSMLDLCQQRSI